MYHSLTVYSGFWWIRSLFFTTGHQATFPHIQWSAAFIGLEGTQIAGESFTGHMLPGLLVGWNTFSCAIISSLALPLLLLAPFSMFLLIPRMRPVQNTHHQSNGSGGGGGLFGSALYDSLERGESLLLDHPEETHAALANLAIKFLVIKGFKVFCCMLAAAVLRRHLMVWKIFAPKFIFEAVGFLVALLVLAATLLLMRRVYNALATSFIKLKVS
eukprot:TRINITY_DN26391_c1_g1_i7.p2 TRINITY_DN26391_c1_g1~~TRINITY_DN26391_c1_g1_i7.p2  ORF type:complete len:215 (+),score=26.96 TRINITY_DN26391_c1_g1_i7:1015-1659(+)